MIKPKNLVAEVLRFVFTALSYITYIRTVLDGNDSVVYLTALIYILPQLIDVTTEVCSEYLTPVLFKLDVAAIISGALLSISTFAYLSYKGPYSVYVSWALVILSVSFVVRPVYKFGKEIKKHKNVHDSIRESLEEQ